VRRAKSSYTHYPCFLISPADARCCNRSCTDNTSKWLVLHQNLQFCQISIFVGHWWRTAKGIPRRWGGFPSKKNRTTKPLTSYRFLIRFYKGWAEYFFPTPMTKPPGGPGGPTPPTPFEKTLFSNFGAKIQINSAKIQMYGAKIQIYSANFKYMAPKLKYLNPNSNKWIFVPLKTSRFVRGKLPTPPACQTPTPSSVLFKD